MQEQQLDVGSNLRLRKTVGKKDPELIKLSEILLKNADNNIMDIIWGSGIDVKISCNEWEEQCNQN